MNKYIQTMKRKRRPKAFLHYLHDKKRQQIQTERVKKKKRSALTLNARNKPCIVCDGEFFTWGYCTSQGHNGITVIVKFRQDDSKWGTETTIRARRYDLCGNILLFDKV